MRSCEYSSVNGPRKTKIICLGDISFHNEKSNKSIHHADHNLHEADTVTITFRDQKNNEKNESRTAWRTNDPLACSVRAAANLVSKITLHQHSNKTPINTIHIGQTKKYVTSSMILTRLRSAAIDIGEEALGHSHRDIGTHSIRSGAAMALALSGHPDWRIMITGRWKSTSFLDYIRYQIQQFSKGVSQKMTLHQKHTITSSITTKTQQEAYIMPTLNLNGKIGRR